MSSSKQIYDAVVAAIPANIREQTPNSLLQWTYGETPISTVGSVVTAAVVYLSTIFGLQWIMSSRPAAGKGPIFKAIFLAHNIALSLGSGLLLALIVEEVSPIWRYGGTLYSVCSSNSWTSKLETYYIINYYFKYWELADTVFLVLKKKPLQFLHVYHHAATAALCWTQLQGKTSVSWLVISLNLGVHVVMYGYYALSTLRIPCPWKKLVTVAQITQFFIDLFFVYGCTYTFYAHKYADGILPHMGTCYGTPFAAFSGCAILSSYLVLFLSFYRKTYKKPTNAKVAINGNGKAIANGNGITKTNSVANGNGIAKKE